MPYPTGIGLFFAFAFLWAVLLGALASCRPELEPATPPLPVKFRQPTAVSTVVSQTSDSRLVESADRSVRLYIPIDLVDLDWHIQILSANTAPVVSMPAGYAEPYRTVVLELSHKDNDDFGSLYQNPLTLLIRLDTLFASFNTVPDDLVVLRFAESLQDWERVPATMDFPWLRIHTKANSLGMFVISETVDEATSVDRGVAKASVEGATVEPKATVVQDQIGLRIANVTLESPHPLSVHPSATPAVVPPQVPSTNYTTDTGATVSTYAYGIAALSVCVKRRAHAHARP